MGFDGLLLTAALASGDAAPPPPQAAATEWAIRDAPDAMRPAIARADAVIADVHAAPLRELQAKLANGGPLLAPGVCHMTPASLARRIQQPAGLTAGFTSDRLRDPANAPPPWAAGLIARHAGAGASAVEGFTVDLGHRFGVLRPVVEQPICANCCVHDGSLPCSSQGAAITGRGSDASCPSGSVGTTAAPL
jgi:hypothetical protein